MRAFSVANIDNGIGESKKLEFDSEEYGNLVVDMGSTVDGLILRRADEMAVKDACGTESLDTVTEFWNRIHQADENYRSFVVNSVFTAFMQIGEQFLGIDAQTALTLTHGAKAAVDYSGTAGSKEKNDPVVGYKPKTKDNNAKTVQQLLLRAGINVQGGADGYFGSNTAKAVIEFQKKYGAEFGLTVCQYGENGELTYVDEKTLEAMRIVAQRNNNSAAAQGQYGNEPYLDLDGSTVTNKRDWLQWAAAQNGFEEVGNNGTPFGEFTGTDNQPWCAAYVSWCLYQAGDTTLSATASTANMKNEAIQLGIYNDLRNPQSECYNPDYVPEAGDIFYRTRDGGGHVGFISSVTDNGNGTYTITTMEGNSDDMAQSHTYTLTQDQFKDHWNGIIEMNREEKTSESGNVTVQSVEDTGYSME